MEASAIGRILWSQIGPSQSWKERHALTPTPSTAPMGQEQIETSSSPQKPSVDAHSRLNNIVLLTLSTLTCHGSFFFISVHAKASLLSSLPAKGQRLYLLHFCPTYLVKEHYPKHLITIKQTDMTTDSQQDVAFKVQGFLDETGYLDPFQSDTGLIMGWRPP